MTGHTPRCLRRPITKGTCALARQPRGGLELRKQFGKLFQYLGMDCPTSGAYSPSCFARFTLGISSADCQYCALTGRIRGPEWGIDCRGGSRRFTDSRFTGTALVALSAGPYLSGRLV